VHSAGHLLCIKAWALTLALAMALALALALALADPQRMFVA
jgi:hypothetical protein